MSFSSDIRRFSKKARRNAELTFRGTALGLFGKVIQRTPVDTGRLRGNWQTQVNTAPSDELDRKGAGPALRELQSVALRAKLGDSIYLVNNLPYAKPIEEGRSDQAPQGMVRVTLLSFRRLVAAQARKHRK